MRFLDRVRRQFQVAPDISPAGPLPGQASPLPISAGRSRIQLKFTGTASREEFEAACRQQDFWYHSFYFDNGYVQRGDYDIGLDVADYGFPETLQGVSVLDIGAGSGWFTTYFEQQGADVTVTDARGYCDFDVFGRDRNPDVTSEKAAPDRLGLEGQPLYYSPVSKGFWIVKDLLGLKARYCNARVYEIGPALFGGRTFDLVFMGSVLMHVRDPIGALMAAHSVCKGQLIATTYVMDDLSGISGPVMRLHEGADNGINWWIPNRACLEQWLKAAGFVRYEIDRCVRLTTDKVYSDANGLTSGVDQVQTLIHAWV